MSLVHIDPDGMPSNPAFTQGVRIDGPGSLLVVGGQNGIGPDGAVVSDDVGEQGAQALRNVLAVVEAAGATQADIAKLTIHVVGDADFGALYGAAQEVWGTQRTAVTVVRVAGLGSPDWLVEIEALAQIPANAQAAIAG